MDEKELHDLYKLKLAKDVKEEVASWIKKSAIIISVFSEFGGHDTGVFGIRGTRY